MTKIKEIIAWFFFFACILFCLCAGGCYALGEWIAEE